MEPTEGLTKYETPGLDEGLALLTTLVSTKGPRTDVLWGHKGFPGRT